MPIIVIFVLFLINVSAHTGKVVDAVEGYTAPFFRLEKEDSAFSLAGMKGKYVLLTFWSSSDASSRIACNYYTDFVKSIGDDSGEMFCHYSVNFDRSERLFRELVRKDGLDSKTQFHVWGEDADRLIQDYHLEDGFKTLLIDPQGRVAVKNPSKLHLTQILNR